MRVHERQRLAAKAALTTNRQCTLGQLNECVALFSTIETRPFVRAANLQSMNSDLRRDINVTLSSSLQQRSAVGEVMLLKALEGTTRTTSRTLVGTLVSDNPVNSRHARSCLFNR